MHFGPMHSRLMHARLALIFSGIALAGCAAPGARLSGYVAMPPVAAGDARGGRSISMPPLPERLKFLALQEWTLWGRGRWCVGERCNRRKGWLGRVARLCEDWDRGKHGGQHYGNYDSLHFGFSCLGAR